MNCLSCENVKILILNFSPQNPPLLAVTFQTQGLEVNINYIPPLINASAQNPKIGINLNILMK